MNESCDTVANVIMMIIIMTLNVIAIRKAPAEPVEISSLLRACDIFCYLCVIKRTNKKSNLNLKVMKVEIKVCQADWVESYSDGMACVTTTEYYPTKAKAKAEFKKDGSYSPDEIDIDPDNHEYGWFLHLETLTFDTNDKFKITVTP